MPLLNITFWLLVGLILGWSLHAWQSGEKELPAEPVAATEPTPEVPAQSSESAQADDSASFQARLARGEVGQTLALYRETRNQDPARAVAMRTALLNRARQLMAQKKPDQAGAILSGYLEIESYDPGALLLRARLDTRRDKYEQALVNALDAKIYDRENTVTESADQVISQITSTWRERLTREKKWHKLGDMYHLLIEKDGDRPEYYYELAGAQYRAGSYYDGLGSLNRILHDPEWGAKARKLSRLVEQLMQLGEGAPIELTRAGNGYLIEARVNGRRADLLLDTGASISIVRRQFADTIGLSAEDGKKTRFNAVGSQVEVTIVNARSFRVGNVAFEDMALGIAEMPETFSADGLLGMDFLGNFEFSIDQDNEVLNLKAP